jgi:hypothetical protein
MNLHNFFESLSSNSSRNFKIEQLTRHSDNETLREVVRLALDPFTNFYIRKIPQYQTDNRQTSLENALNGLYDLSSRTVTGNAAIEYLRMLLSSVSADDAKVIERVIQKDLKCGVQVSTANTVWGGLIKEYPVMLCSGYEQKLVDKVKFPALVQLKMDGMRFNAIVQHNESGSSVDYRSRNGKEIQLLGNLDEEFIKLSNGIDCVFDGELLVKDNGKILDRQTGNGILNKANKGTISAKEAAMVNATVWDVIPYAYFVDAHCPVAYSSRFESLCALMDMHKPTKIGLVDNWEVETLDEAKTLFEGLLAQGQEGIILKDKTGTWEDKRVKHQIKFKGELECDLKIVAVEEGTGKYAGMLGAIICESSDGIVKVNVGSGFNDEHRKNLWKENLVDKIVAVKYNSRIKNKAGEESLFLPIFVEIRDDKEVADNSKVIK